ncbi:MAG: fatty acid--CoA ligase family protein [Thalassobaculum sp.]|uniref:class I adenylate-forming enzyme family protein n=1 Tax=Thalassobaculum sp. TaxID=2022740 RepID=UPI0032ED7665
MTPLAEALFDALARRGDAVVIEGQDENLTASRIVEEAELGARTLRAEGLRRFAPVPVEVDNRPTDVIDLLAVYRAGGVAVPIHRATPEVRRRQMLDLLGPSPLYDGAATVVFTSGSTGAPKGVVLRGDRQAAKLVAIRDETAWPEGARTLLALQLTFSFGQWVAWLTLLTGGTLVIPERLTLEAVARRLAAGGVDRLPAVPTLLRALVETDAPAFPGTVLAGGERLPAGLGGRLREAWPAARLGDIYGLTETGTSDFFVDPDDYDAAAGSLGRPARGIDVRVADDGELRIRSPWGMAGYLQDPERIAAAFDEDGYFRTGDLVSRRDDGRLALVGRASEMINKGGLKVAPREVEDALATHPGVAAVLVTGIPDQATGEAVAAGVVARPGVELDPEALRSWVAERIEKYKAPSRIQVLPALPAGRTGKADRGMLRALFRKPRRVR